MTPRDISDIPFEDATNNESLIAAYQNIREGIEGSYDLDIRLVDEWTEMLTPEERNALIGATLSLLEGLYVHLPLKHARQPIDAIRSLEILRNNQRSLDDQAFHEKFMMILKDLRDSHTAYTPPGRFKQLVAFLPFMVEHYYEPNDEEPSFVISRLLAGFEHSTFEAGAEVTSWNGVPIRRAVQRNAERENGNSPEAMLALGLEFMTVRWLGLSLPPDATSVDVGYLDEGGRSLQIRLPWRLIDVGENKNFQIGQQVVWLMEEQDSPETKSSESFGEQALNQRTQVEHLSRRYLFRKDKCEEDLAQREENEKHLAQINREADRGYKGPELGRDTVPDERKEDSTVQSKIPSLFEARKLSDDLGYIRIRGFVYPQEPFFNEFRHLLSRMPQQQLILDIRDNPGGTIQNAERLLQLLTPNQITPIHFQLITSDLTQLLTHPPKDATDPMKLRRWGESIDLARETGALYSAGIPLTDPVLANAVGQEYYGAIVLITSASTYSAGDMFAAGFQDHEIGPIIGVDPTTGGGGANVSRYGDVTYQYPHMQKVLEDLPKGARIQFSFRRTMRVGANLGVPIEEVGVTADYRHKLTQRDVTSLNEDLLAHATKILHEDDKCVPRLTRLFKMSIERGRKGWTVAGDINGVDRLDIYINRRPIDSIDIGEGTDLPYKLPKLDAEEFVVDLQGFAENQLVARHKKRIKQA